MADQPPGETYRYERKFTVEGRLPSQVQALIRCHPSFFIEPYPPRWVNNFYLDTPELENYFANLQGAAARRKVRLRWYGNLLGCLTAPTLELKIKRGLVGTKIHYDFPVFELNPGFSQVIFDHLVESANLPAELRHLLRDQSIVLMNRYWRRYYASRDGRFRLTLDSDLTYCRIDRLYNNFIHQQTDRSNLVVELKYDPVYDSQAQRVARAFPFRLTRNSKYSLGIERVYF